ncbi:MAG: DNA-deoxyinosine glycosylase [Burkholderiaceae bacterium]
MEASAMLTGLEPRITPDCKLVVLGSFPGVASLRAGHYYAHPRNLFWAIMSQALGLAFNDWPFDTRYQALNKAGVGLWDVIANCERPGSLDSNIRQASASQLNEIIQMAPGVTTLLLNGRKAEQGARQWVLDGVSQIALPSTSPANAGISEPVKRKAWCDAITRVLQ